MFDKEYDEDLRYAYRMLEELLSETSWRATGGFRTEDQKFALKVDEAIKEMLGFLDNLNLFIDNAEQIFQNEVDERDEEISKMNRKFAAVQDYINQQKLLQRLEEILDS